MGGDQIPFLSINIFPLLCCLEQSSSRFLLEERRSGADSDASLEQLQQDQTREQHRSEGRIGHNPRIWSPTTPLLPNISSKCLCLSHQAASRQPHSPPRWLGHGEITLYHLTCQRSLRLLPEAFWSLVLLWSPCKSPRARLEKSEQQVVGNPKIGSLNLPAAFLEPPQSLLQCARERSPARFSTFSPKGRSTGHIFRKQAKKLLRKHWRLVP